MRAPCPRIVVAGTHSGVGKTSVTLALVSALRRRGLRVQTFKVGPDYLDPTYLGLVSGRPCYNLDGWMTGRGYVEGLFAEKAAGADVAVIEGVMGLFDGSDPVGRGGSTAEVASWLDAPVLLVVSGHGIAGSVAALVRGYSEFDPKVRVAGVIANQCGSGGHAAWLGESLLGSGLPELVAAVPRGAFPTLPSRHLGLVTADARNLPEHVAETLGHALESHGSVDGILRIARGAPPMTVQDEAAIAARPVSRVKLGLAWDEAFHFYYPDNLEALEAGGCELIRFSPLRDGGLPPGIDVLYLGGGYPEEHAQPLSENKGMIESIRSFAAAGGAIYAECGGLMYLAKGIEMRNGRRWKMTGLLPQWTRMGEKLRSLGYVEATFTEDSLWGCRGAQLRGHEFHYSELLGDPAGEKGWRAVYRMRRPRFETLASEGFQRGRVLASYMHAHFGCRPESVENFVRVCSGPHRIARSKS